MNKKYLFFLFLLFLVFIFPFEVNAKTVGINFDSNERFNYFYEQKNNTDFYQFLLSKGDGLYSYLCSINYGLNSYNVCSNHSGYILIFYSSELENYISIPSNTKYVIVINPYNIDVSDSSLSFSSSGDIYSISGFSGSLTSSCNNYRCNRNFYFFDENSNYISSSNNNIESSTISFNLSLTSLDFEIKDKSIDSMSNFSYLLSKFYYGDNFISLGNISDSTMIVSDLYIDGHRYLIDDNDNYSGFLTWFRTFFTSSDTYSVIDSNLEYFKSYTYFSPSSIKLLSLYKIISYGSESLMNIPSGYTSYTIPHNGVFLVPLNTSSTNNNKIYVSSSGFPKLFIDYWTISNTGLTSLSQDYRLIKTILKSNSIGLLNLLEDSTKTPLTYSDYVYQLGYGFVDSSTTSPLKYYATLYYDSSVYSIQDVNLIDGNVITYPGSSDTFTLSGNDIVNSNSNHSGASVNIFSPVSEQQEISSNYSELFNSDGSISGNSVSWLSKSLSFLTSFSKIILTLFSLVSTLFIALPVGVQSLFQFLLFGGVIIIIYRLIRGS